MQAEAEAEAERQANEATQGTDTAVEMALLTMIARVIDGLPLVGTMQDDEQVSRACLYKDTHTRKHTESNDSACVPAFTFTYISPWQTGRSILDYQNQAKMLFRKLGTHSPARSSIETGPYLFQWVFVYRPHMRWCNLRSNKLTNLLCFFSFIASSCITPSNWNWIDPYAHTYNHTHTAI